MPSAFLRPPSLASSSCNLPSPSPSCVMNSCALQMVSRPERFTNLCNPLRLDAPRISRGRYLRISSFKGNAQNNELGDKMSKSTSSKHSVGVSYVPRDANSLNLHDVSISCTSQSDDVRPRSQAIQNLFRHWLNLLWADSQTHGEKIAESPAKDVLRPQKDIHLKGEGEVLKVVFEYFMRLDASVKIPLLIFAPFYLAVSLVFGVKVSKELTPLWIIGPLVAALYVKMIQGLAALYLLSYERTIQSWKDLPIYYDKVCKYIADGNLKPAQLLKMGKMNESESKQKRQAYEDRYEDVLGWFSQLFWPVRYRIIKVLKRAKLI